MGIPFKGYTSITFKGYASNKEWLETRKERHLKNWNKTDFVQ